MAFMSMMFAGAAIIILLIISFLSLSFLLTAAVLKIVNRKRHGKRIKIISNIFLVAGILFAVPGVYISVRVGFNENYSKVEQSNGRKVYVKNADVEKMNKYADSGNTDALNKLLDSNKRLADYLDINHKGLIDRGLEKGDLKVVEAALDHGAIFDDPRRYDVMAYDHTSMESYLNAVMNRDDRTITADDVGIIKLMFEKKVSTAHEYKEGDVYSNVLGIAAWDVLYNDGQVTGTELKFIKIFNDNGFSSDDKLLLADELGDNYTYGPEYHLNVKKDRNYRRLLHMVGRGTRAGLSEN